MTQLPGPESPPLYAQLSSSWLGREPSGSPISPPEISEPKHAVVEEDVVNHPKHYKCPNPKYDYQVIQVIEAWFLNKEHYLATAVAYILRALYKDNAVQDVRKAVWYLNRWADLEEEASQLDTPS